MARRSPRTTSALLALWMVLGAMLGIVVVPGAAQADPLPPAIGATDAVDLSDTAATLMAMVTSNDTRAAMFFEFGPTDAYGRSTPVGTITAPGAKNVYALIRNLSPGTTYHYRAVVANNTSTTRSPDATFTTTGTPIVVSAGPSPGVGATGDDGAVDPSMVAAATVPVGPAVLFAPKTPAPTVSGRAAATPLVTLSLTCAAGGARCDGLLVLTAPRKVTLADSRRTISIANGSFSIPPATTAPVTMKITHGARTLIARAKRRHQALSLATTLQGQPTSTRPLELTSTKLG